MTIICIYHPSTGICAWCLSSVFYSVPPASSSHQDPFWTQDIWSFALSPYLLVLFLFILSEVLSLHLSLAMFLSSLLPHNFSVFIYISLSLCDSLSPQSQMCTVSTQKHFPHPGHNKQLFAVWNNKDCHHGYSSIPCALSGPFRVLKGAIIWWHQRQATT